MRWLHIVGPSLGWSWSTRSGASTLPDRGPKLMQADAARREFWQVRGAGGGARTEAGVKIEPPDCCADAPRPWWRVDAERYNRA